MYGRLAATVLLVSLHTGAALAAPVFLKCDIAKADGTSRVHVNVNLNEEAETAGVVFETGGSVQKVPAVFAPDTVTWRTDRTGFKVNRSTLLLTEEYYVGGRLIPSMTRAGPCTLPPAVDRQF
jgi:hypothetical protein